MKQTIILFLFAIPFSCMAQSLVYSYEYDASGNRTLRKTIQMNLAPPAPPDSTFIEQEELENLVPLVPEYFVEKIAQTQIKIYPNPATEKITMQIAGWEDLQTGNFKLFSLNGKLLQEHPVRSETTTISLSTLPKGAYILKVQINNRSEEWKVIKN